MLERLQQVIVDACGKGLLLAHALKLIIYIFILQAFILSIFKYLFFSFFKLFGPLKRMEPERMDQCAKRWRMAGA
jgi:hypothetical protein